MGTTQPIRSMEQLQLFKNYYRTVKPHPRNNMLITLGLNSALRISDLLSLRCGDLYNYEKGDFRSHIVIREGKTGKYNRIYINGEVRRAVSACIQPDGRKPQDWLFISQRQKARPLSRYQAYRLVKEAAIYAGLPADISCHSLRKTFGYHAWKQGTPPALLMNIYNHSAYQITRRYLCIDQDDKDEVFANIKI